METETMSYEQALKKVAATKKPSENYMMVEISYNKKFILPYASGLLFMQAFSTAEELHDGYSEQIRISGTERSSVRTAILSNEEYTQIKIAELLQLKLDDVQRMKIAA